MVVRILCCFIFSFAGVAAGADTLRHPFTLEQQLLQVDPAVLVREARTRGNAARGALVFYKSAAACVHCHVGGGDASPLGPDLAKLGDVSDVYIVESLLRPSMSIRKGYETHSILTTSGEVLVGMIVKQDDATMTLRIASDLSHDLIVALEDVETIRASDNSMMPDGLVGALGEQRDFLDLTKYLLEIAAGGPARAEALKPSAEQLAVKDDTADLDHAGIIKKLRQSDFDAGKAIYHGYCFDCHGSDGNTPSLPTARAFGTQKLRFGADPYRMFMTLSHGNGLMAPMSHLTPKERYQVVHYIRQQFMEPHNEEYFKVTAEYLAGLPTGSKDGTEVEEIHRDFGPALASQLRRQYSSVLTIPLGDLTLSYDLHTMNLAGVWRDGFLDLSQTQHTRDRGEGAAMPGGEEIPMLAGWRWGHGGTLDYPADQLLPRGPMPDRWMHYRGHYLSGRNVVLSYEIDERPILELPRLVDGGIVRSLQVSAGEPLVLAIADGLKTKDAKSGVFAIDDLNRTFHEGAAAETIIASLTSRADGIDNFLAAAVTGNVHGLTWSVDDQSRLVLRIPADDKVRHIDVTCVTGNGRRSLTQFAGRIESVQTEDPSPLPQSLTGGGPLLWPEEVTTIGYRGLEQGGYALDTLTIPDATPWNTWFRTSALDFFPDGRMALATYGGDIWIVSGIDEDLLQLRWKRFAAGLYEPFGVKVVDGHVYVTCKDRLTKLHDQDGNGEADFYESFSADTDVSVNFHAFNFDLQTDPAGNFFYAKSGHGADWDIPGGVIKVSPDGRKRELYCSGFRSPNGIGILPDGRVTASDNQGQWTPASKISLVRPGGFYGWVQTYSIPGMWEPGGGTIDVKKVVPPKSFDPPLVWMPQDFDNSSGGQLFVDDPRWGPLSGRLLHTSFGKGWMSYLMMQEIDGVAQAAIIKLPMNFRTGIMRARVNPADGQVYATGLQGWNGGGRIGLLDSGVQRVRYTGKPDRFVTDCQVNSDGLKIMFNFPLDPDLATNTEAFTVEHWNYHWRAEYGSDMHSPTTDEPGAEKLVVEAVSLGAGRKSVELKIPDLKPVNQVHVVLKVKSSDGTPFEEEIYWTINRLPGSRR